MRFADCVIALRGALVYMYSTANCLRLWLWPVHGQCPVVALPCIRPVALRPCRSRVVLQHINHVTALTHGEPASQPRRCPAKPAQRRSGFSC
jgi:hypothetical protein